MPQKFRIEPGGATVAFLRANIRSMQPKNLPESPKELCLGASLCFLGAFCFSHQLVRSKGSQGAGLLQILIGIDRLKCANHANIFILLTLILCLLCVFLVLIFPGQKACAGANIYAFCISGLALWVDLDLVSSFQSLVRTCWLTSTKL